MSNLPVERDRRDAKIAGVCAALARAWWIDPLIVRLAFVVLAVMTNGFIVAAYFGLWALLPERGSESPLHRAFPVTRTWSSPVLVSAVVLAAAVFGAIVSGSGPGAFVILAIAWLIARFGFAGRRTPTASPPAPLAPPPASRFEELSRMWEQRLDNIEAGRPADWVPELTYPDPAGLYGPEPVLQAAPATRRRGLRTWLGILVGLGSVWAGLAVADAVGLAIPDLAWAAATLAVLGLALVVVARPSRAAWGRPPMLLPVTILTAVVTALMISPVPVPSPARGLAEAPTGVAALSGTHELSIGDHTIDLRTAAVEQGSRASYRLDIGTLVVVVPAEGNVVVNAVVDVGDLTTPDGPVEGLDARHSWSRIEDQDAPTLTIDASVGLGDLEVRS